MLGELENQFSLTRAALSTRAAQKRFPISKSMTRILFTLISVVLLSGTGRASRLVSSPRSDGNVWYHFGLGAFSIDTSGPDVSANFSPIEELRGVFEFPVNSIPQGSLVTSATLQLYVWFAGGNSGTTGSYQLCGFAGDGAVTTGDWANDGLALQSFNNTVGNFGPRIFDVTAFVQSRVSAGDAYSGFLVKGFTPNVLVGFTSLEYTGGFPRPLLDVWYTPIPEPGVITLLVLAGTVMLFGRPGALRTWINDWPSHDHSSPRP